MKLIFLFLPLFLLADGFISKMEYSEMLYNNPRGISCAKCHGKDGKGSVIATYINDKTGKMEKLVVPDITKLSYKIFYMRLKYSKILKKGRFRTINYSAMPKYDYLVDDEIKSLYDYLHIYNKKDKKEKEKK
jgi:mono/diheme cytochrome c family protein